MKLVVRETEFVTIVDLDGNLTIGGGDKALRELTVQLLDSDRKSILLNMAGVQYMDSAGIGEMVACSKLARERRAEVKLLHPTRKVREMLRITRFEELFEIHEDERAAVASFSAG
jgi:anti-sigma B factor antagonist